MEVNLIAHTTDPVRVLWTAAKTCKTETAPLHLFNSETPEKEMIEVLRRVWRAGHLSVFEHVNLTYAIEEISRVCLAEFTRHRTGITYSVKGQRMPLKSIGYIRPGINEDRMWIPYREAVKHAINCYHNLVNAGVPAEDARYVLPQATLCNLVCTVNLRELKHLWDERGNNPHAHWEVRYLVRDMVAAAVDKFPWLVEVNWEWAGVTA